MTPTRPTMQDRALYDDLLTQFIQEQPDDTGRFSISQVCIYHGAPLDRRWFAGHVRGLIGSRCWNNRPFTILRSERVKSKGSDPQVYFHYAKKKPARPSAIKVLLPHEGVSQGL